MRKLMSRYNSLKEREAAITVREQALAERERIYAIRMKEMKDNAEQVWGYAKAMHVAKIEYGEELPTGDIVITLRRSAIVASKANSFDISAKELHSMCEVKSVDAKGLGF